MPALPDTEMQDLTAKTDVVSTDLVPFVRTSDTTQDPGGSAYVWSAATIAEYIRDTIGTAITQGTGITVTVSDGSDTITIASSITQYTDEMARDALGTALTAGNAIAITPNDGADTITVAVSGLDQADVAPAVVALSDGATVTLDASLGRTFRVTLGGNRTLAITNPTDGQVIELEVIQDGTGSRTLTLPASVRFSTTAPDTLYVLSTTAAKRDYLTLKYNSAATKWDAVGFLAGF